jgi:hypothetical protein
MGKLALNVAAAALMLGSLAFAANAQTLQPGAGSLHGQAQNANPVKQAACFGYGACGPGWHRVCGPYRCWCRPC